MVGNCSNQRMKGSGEARYPAYHHLIMFFSSSIFVRKLYRLTDRAMFIGTYIKCNNKICCLMGFADETGGTRTCNCVQLRHLGVYRRKQ